MSNKYILEIGGPSMYIGYSVEARKLYATYEQALDEYTKILHNNYSNTELEDEDLLDRCYNNVNPEFNYIKAWVDDENDCYLCIYEVEEN